LRPPIPTATVFFSETEQRAYAQRVLADLLVSIDGEELKPRLQTVSFPSPADMKEGLGEIHIEFAADLPAGGPRRTFVIENRHQSAASVYLMNCLAPRDSNIRLVAQSRNQTQSYYRVDYEQSGPEPDVFSSLWRSHLVAAVAPLAGVPNMFRLGMRHIAEGTDHLLFLLALLLPAPLVARRRRWTSVSGLRQTLLRIVGIVSAFTIGHSITLALGALGVVSLPEPPVELLIAISILVSAIHAMRPVFPGREPIIAGFFGLIHGLAFASTLQNLGVGLRQRVASVLGFNLGIETMQLIVVGAILPSLLILSRTGAYSVFRWVGAVIAGLAALGWMLERSIGISTPVDLVVNQVAQRGAWVAVVLLAISAVLWIRRLGPPSFDSEGRPPVPLLQSANSGATRE
jgi:hypothetical protein